MFVRRSQGLFEFAMAALCVWAAYHHTPLGALARHLGAGLFGVRTTARPPLAYYASTGRLEHRVVSHLPAPIAGAERLALAFALQQHLQGGGPRPQLSNGLAGARGQLERLERELGSQDAAVLALFAGREPARYAAERVRAEGVSAPALEDLARQLPPGFEDAVGAAGTTLAGGIVWGLGWPVPSGTKISSGFGMRRHPVLGSQRLHTGVDLPLPVGTPVRAAGRGVVRRASFDAVNGHVLVIDHGRGVTTAYCHNDALAVRAGEVVEAGQVISLSGNTGRSTGPHLHYQLELDGRPVDPLRYRRSAPALASPSPP
jgi:murein DD-endopeptidase